MLAERTWSGLRCFEASERMMSQRIVKNGAVFETAAFRSRCVDGHKFTVCFSTVCSQPLSLILVLP